MSKLRRWYLPEHVVSLLLLLERIARLESHEFVQVEQNVEQHPGDVAFVGSSKVRQGNGLGVHGVDHVDHLAQHVLEVDWLLSQTRHSMQLDFVEVSHLLGHQPAVAVEIAADEPVPQRGLRRLVLFRQHEIDEVGESHAARAEPALASIGERTLTHLEDSDVARNNQSTHRQ